MSGTAAPLDVSDSQRAELAAANKYKVTKAQLIDLYECYKTRRPNKEEYCKDLLAIQALGGTEELLSILDTSIEKGIAATTFADRIAQFGSNMPKPKERTTFCELVWEALQDFMIRLLIVCAIFALVTEMAFAKDAETRSYAWVEGAGILAAVAFVTLFTAASDYNKETQFLENQAKEYNAKVVSKSFTYNISSRFISIYFLVPSRLCGAT